VLPFLADILSSGIIDKALSFIPNPEQARQAKAEIEKELTLAAVKAEADQREINKTEAASGNMFVAGWRPGAGWVTVICIALYFIPKFVLGAFFWSMAVWKAGMLLPYPDLGVADVMGLLGTLLGVGTLRTIEKYNGTDTKTIK
jgi:Holin of 3TMs, for gene-transfer release